MEYCITKECGDEWGDPLPVPADNAWGVSETQRRLAERVAPGDIFLHYIDYAHAWAGYSTVSGVLQNNRRDSDADVLAALPYVIPIKPVDWLNEGQCERTARISRLSDKHYHRRAAFTRIPPNEAELIIKAIKTAAAVQSIPSSLFHERWKKGAENYNKRIVKGLASGKCCLCGEDAASWTTRAAIALSKAEHESIRDRFLDAAHIVADCDLGKMTPDNLRALCPNCHRVVDRLSNERREKLLRKK